MENKQELKKQLIICSCILVLVIIGAILINSKNNTNRINTNLINKQTTTINNEEQKENITDNLKGLLAEPEDEINEQQEKEIKEMIDATSNNGIPTTVED